MRNWQVPVGMTGDPGLIRVSSRMARRDEHGCPTADRAKAHPAVSPAVTSYPRIPGRPDFVFQPFMTALDMIEYQAHPVDKALARAARPQGRDLAPHEGLMNWTTEAVERYVDLGPVRTPDGVTLDPYPHEWTYRWSAPASGSAPHTMEMTAWGRRYRSADGRVRELRLPRLGVAGERERSPAEISVAAYVVARGGPARRPPRWHSPYRMLDTADQVERVRIVEYGCADGSTVVLFDGTPAEADALYREYGRDRLGAVVETGDARPGGSCVKCKLTSVCGTLVRVRGLLGIVDTDRPRRTWSITNGRDYRLCPAKEHLRRLHLPRDGEYGPDAQRGQAVHALLAALHAREPKRACTPADGPVDPSEWQAGGWYLSGEQAELGAAQFLAHVAMCPLPRPDADAGVGEVRSESPITVHDTAANVIVVATPDLVYAQDGSWVWRETKTSRRDVAAAGTEHLMESYPQVALGVVLLAERVLGGDPTFSRVELEILRAGGADIHLFDPGDADEVTRAREVVHHLASPWHGDAEHAPRPGPHCVTCEVSRWCSASAA